MEFILVAAAPFEIEPASELLAKAGVSHSTFIVGIGALRAAEKCSELAEACRGKHVVFIGTCGTFGTYIPLEIVEVQSIHWLPVGVRLGQAYTINGTMPSLHLRAGPTSKVRARLVDAVCCSEISITSVLPRDYVPDSLVENVELYSVAGAILGTAATFRAFLCVTNKVGPDSHVSWKANFKSAAMATANFLVTQPIQC
jgi:hypothetical protein